MKELELLSSGFGIPSLLGRQSTNAVLSPYPADKGLESPHDSSNPYWHSEFSVDDVRVSSSHKAFCADQEQNPHPTLASNSLPLAYITPRYISLGATGDYILRHSNCHSTVITNVEDPRLAKAEGFLASSPSNPQLDGKESPLYFSCS